MNKRSGNDGCLNSLDLIHQNKLFPNHLIYFTCFFILFYFIFFGFSAVPETGTCMVCYDKKSHLIFSNKNKFYLMLYTY